MNVKIILIVGAILIGLGFIRWAYVAAYDAGYNAAVVAQTDEAIEQQNAAIQKGIDNWIETNKDSLVTVITQEVIVEKIREVEREVPKIIEKIVEVKPECSRLGSDYLRVYNSAIDASNNYQGDSTPVTGELVTGMQAIDSLAFRSIN